MVGCRSGSSGRIVDECDKSDKVSRRNRGHAAVRAVAGRTQEHVAHPRAALGRGGQVGRQVRDLPGAWALGPGDHLLKDRVAQMTTCPAASPHACRTGRNPPESPATVRPPRSAPLPCPATEWNAFAVVVRQRLLDDCHQSSSRTSRGYSRKNQRGGTLTPRIIPTTKEEIKAAKERKQQQELRLTA
jgi:hypothetical protein